MKKFSEFMAEAKEAPVVVSEADAIIEKLTAGDEAGKWVHDFVHSDNPKFKGKSTKERQQMALAAYYSAKRNEAIEGLTEEDIQAIDEWNAKDMMAAAKARQAGNKTSKGTKYTGAEAEAEFDEHGNPKRAEPAEKRGRGRPAGSKSGARTHGAEGGSGSSGSEHRLRLPSQSVYFK